MAIKRLLITIGIHLLLLQSVGICAMNEKDIDTLSLVEKLINTDKEFKGQISEQVVEKIVRFLTIWPRLSYNYNEGAVVTLFEAILNEWVLPPVDDTGNVDKQALKKKTVERFAHIKKTIEAVKSFPAKIYLLYVLQQALDTVLVETARLTSKAWYKSNETMERPSYIERMRILLDLGAQVNITQEENNSLLHNSELTPELYDLCTMEYGLNPEVLNGRLETPMEYSIKKSYDGLFKLLIKKGVNVHYRHIADGRSYVTTAVKNGNYEALRTLLLKGVNVDGKTLDAILTDALNLDLAEHSKRRSKVVKLILGQQPQALTCLPAAYQKLVNATTQTILDQECATWFDNSTNLPIEEYLRQVHTRLLPVILYGEPWQIKATIEWILTVIPTNIDVGPLFGNTTGYYYDDYGKRKSIRKWGRSTVLLSFLVRALNYAACPNFFRLLLLNVQNGFGEYILNIKKSMLENIVKKHPSARPLFHNFFVINQAFEKYDWVHDMPGLHAAFEPERMQKRLNGTLKNQGKSCKKMQDIVIKMAACYTKKHTPKKTLNV